MGVAWKRAVPPAAKQNNVHLCNWTWICQFLNGVYIKRLHRVNCPDPNSDPSLLRITSTIVLLSVLFQIFRSGQVSGLSIQYQ